MNWIVWESMQRERLGESAEVNRFDPAAPAPTQSLFYRNCAPRANSGPRSVYWIAQYADASHSDLDRVASDERTDAGRRARGNDIAGE